MKYEVMIVNELSGFYDCELWMIKSQCYLFVLNQISIRAVVKTHSKREMRMKTLFVEETLFI